MKIKNFYTFTKNPEILFELLHNDKDINFMTLEEVKGNTYLLPNISTPLCEKGMFPVHLIGRKLTKEEVLDLVGSRTRKVLDIDSL